jgi:hypothetical protein
MASKAKLSGIHPSVVRRFSSISQGVGDMLDDEEGHLGPGDDGCGPLMLGFSLVALQPLDKAPLTTMTKLHAE